METIKVESEVDVAIRLARLLVANSAGERDSVLVLARGLVKVAAVVGAARRIVKHGRAERHPGHAAGADDNDVGDWVLEELAEALDGIR